MPNIELQGKSDAGRNQQQVIFDKLNALEHRLLLSEIRSEVDGAERDINQAQSDIALVRTKGHRFDADLEQAIALQKPAVKETRELLEGYTDNINRTLRPEFDSMTRKLQAASVSGWELTSLASRLDEAERELNRIETEIRSRISDHFNELTEISNRTRSLVWAYKQLEEASFSIDDKETCLVSAWEAQWLGEDGKSGPWGVLYLTTKYLIFERKEDVTVGRKLLVFAKKEKVQELAFWQSLEVLTRSVDTEERKFLGKKELLTLEFTRDEPAKVTMRLKENSTLVDQLIEDVIGGRLTASVDAKP